MSDHPVRPPDTAEVPAPLPRPANFGVLAKANEGIARDTEDTSPTPPPPHPSAPPYAVAPAHEWHPPTMPLPPQGINPIDLPHVEPLVEVPILPRQAKERRR